MIISYENKRKKQASCNHECKILLILTRLSPLKLVYFNTNLHFVRYVVMVLALCQCGHNNIYDIKLSTEYLTR